ncbi:amino acid kinase family protein [Candidatus Nitrosacidococcus tergens]|uniref:Aspartate/glutamate/uridylate kinase n=1 Tax=Candidatus Nitrosacidococcus tergens TaxID=553981 RepID=A0A7G1Q735_9GAMM|nr:amino acid kinase [Candidatus Nitrosacidococcus tergens]CAB1274253.1 Aspartate/glutamate/uridylate kinase [Candidatus Nitrosacidococcus tergens]
MLQKIWVIKLGGSLYNNSYLTFWLEQIKNKGKGKYVIVPGGGLFADQVRVAQKQWKFADSYAHNMALLAMDQFGYLLQSLAPELSLATRIEEINKVLEEDQTLIWLPSKELINHPDIPQSWEITSDSLALWLACQLIASRLILVKSIKLAQSQVKATDLAKQGIIDPMFPILLNTQNIPCYILYGDQYNQLSNTGAYFKIINS